MSNCWNGVKRGGGSSLSSTGEICAPGFPAIVAAPSDRAGWPIAGEAGVSRRRVLAQAAGMAGAGVLLPGWLRAGSAAAGEAPAGEAATVFPPGFVWGVSTSSYQIEGAAQADGRAPSIWDTFTHTPGKVVNSDSGDIACDHYHRYLEDVALMARGGMQAYRFSVSWSRVLPAGRGPVNSRGLDFYDRLVDALLQKNVAPWLCLYHWDLPQALQDQGGWRNRATAEAFRDYALVMAGRLGDRVRHWIMLNEPSVVALFGHGLGEHAPGLRGRESWAAAIHHQNLAQGLGLAALREVARPEWRLGTVLSVQPIRPSADSPAHRDAATLFDAVWNRSCLDPLFHGRYPEALMADLAPWIKPGDLEDIRQPVDFLGLNYYSRLYQQPWAEGLFGTGFGPTPAGIPQTGMPWPNEPDGLVEQLHQLRTDYGNPPVYVTENGAAYHDWIGPEGKAEDGERIAFLRAHLAAAHQALAEGANLKGWFVWTFLDNFEWGLGYSKHFGLVAVDRTTLKRTPKASYYWYRDVARSNRLRT